MNAPDLRKSNDPTDSLPRSTSTPPVPRSTAEWIASLPASKRGAFLTALDERTLVALPWLFRFWAMPHQLPPEGDWRTWVCLGGRGAGKTRAGSEWVRAQVEGATPGQPGRANRVALVAETLDQAREVMVFGDSGIIACSPPDRCPRYEATRRRLVWPNGAQAQLFSAHAPEALRGPQFDAAWVDELAKWKKAQDAWDMLQFALRLGDDPRCMVTTTPRPIPLLKSLLQRPGTVITHAPTSANRAWLAPSFLAEVQARYGGTRLGRQELEGALMEDVEGTLFPADVLARALCDTVPDSFERVVVAVDPAVTATGDLCGIVVVGAQTSGPPHTWRAWVLEDASVKASSPSAWARAAIDAMQRHKAQRLVAEVNQGGDLIQSVLRQIDPVVPFAAVRAHAGKSARAEPIAALYEQGRVFHRRGLADLEAQMAQMTAQGFKGSGSPDRVDALVWALHALIIEPAAQHLRPNVRSL